ncbi:MAG: Ig-like domain-containing protein, partial [Hyphomicrobium sp.]
MLAFSSDSGVSTSDFITRSAKQTISGTLNSPLISGQVVKISLDNGKTWQSAKVAAGSNIFTLSGVTLKASNTLKVRVEDTSGNKGPEKSQAYIFDTKAPTTLVKSIAFSNDLGTSASDFITNSASQKISGVLSTKLASDEVVKVSIDNGLSWQTAISNVGSSTFMIEGVTLKNKNTLKVRVEDAAGNSGPEKSQAYTLDTAPPTTAVSTLKFSADSGKSSSDFVTKMAAQNISGTLSAKLLTGEVVKISVDNGVTWQTAKAAIGSNVFSLNGIGLKSSNTLLARVEDTAGNAGPTKAQAYVLDTIAPSPILALENDTGTSAFDGITSVGTVKVSGLEAGALWRYSTNGGVGWEVGSGTSFTVSGSGPKSVLVQQVDAAGNISSNTNLKFVLDNSAPTTKVSAFGFLNDTGSNKNDFKTNRSDQTISGTLSSNLADGEIVKVSVDGGATWKAATTNGKTFSLSDVTLKGDNALQVRVENAAGNPGEVISQNYSLDTTPFSAPILGLSIDSGNLNSDKISNVGTVHVTGLENGASWEYSINGGDTWIVGSGSSFNVSGDGVKTVQVRQTDIVGNVSNAMSYSFTLDTTSSGPQVLLSSDTGTLSSDGVTKIGGLSLSGLEPGSKVEYSADGGKNWSATFSAIEGLNTVLVRQTDSAGNTSNATSYSFTLDTTASAPQVALSSDTGASNFDKISKVGTLIPSGLEAGSIVEYSIDGGKNWSTTFNAVEGLNTVLVRQVDLAGNISNATNYSFTYDTTVVSPSVGLSSDTGTSATDRVT